VLQVFLLGRLAQLLDPDLLIVGRLAKLVGGELLLLRLRLLAPFAGHRVHIP
jgi:hypothetical protein